MAYLLVCLALVLGSGDATRLSSTSSVAAQPASKDARCRATFYEMVGGSGLDLLQVSGSSDEELDRACCDLCRQKKECDFWVREAGKTGPKPCWLRKGGGNELVESKTVTTRRGGWNPDKQTLQVQELVKADSNFRCCCNACSSWICGWYSFSDKCRIYPQTHNMDEKPGIESCGDTSTYDRKPSWQVSGGMHNYISRRDEGGCTIPPEEAKKTFNLMKVQFPDNYCKAPAGLSVQVRSLTYGATADVSCATGYEKKVEKVTCEWDTKAEGVYSPPLYMACEVIKDFCKAVSSEAEGKPEVKYGAIDASKDVTCAPGWEPKEFRSVRCGADGNFHPEPQCQKRPGYCAAVQSDLHEVEAATVDETQDVKCADGYEPENQITKCEVGPGAGTVGVFKPAPQCKKIPGFCSSGRLDGVGGPTVLDGVIDETLDFTCQDEGYRPLGRRNATCTADRSFQPQPACELIPDYCSHFLGTGGPIVSKDAHLGEEVTVSCVQGYEVDTPIVKCSESRVFKPYPKCNRIEDFCLGRRIRSSGSNVGRVDDAGLGDQVEVSCAQGYIPEKKMVVCGMHGNFHPRANCVEPPQDYCKAQTGEGLDLPSAELNASIDVACQRGYQPESATTKCSYETGFSGQYVPAPKCSAIPDYCKGMTLDDKSSESPSVNAAGIHEKVNVTCGIGFTSVHQSTTCGEDGQFSPKPRCQLQTDFCPTYVPLVPSKELGLPTVDEAALGQKMEVRCTNGYEAVGIGHVVCTESKVFEPAPSCQKIQDWCLDRTFRTEGSPKVPEAGMGDTIKVACDDGYEANPEEVVCNARGSFAPRPTCQKLPPTTTAPRTTTNNTFLQDDQAKSNLMKDW